LVVAFGAARFAGGGPVKRIHDRLRKQCQSACTVVDVDEYYTSQKCPRCHGFVSKVYGNYAKGAGISARLPKEKKHRLATSRRRPPLNLERREEEIDRRLEQEEADFSEGRGEKKRDDRYSFVYALKACQTCCFVCDRDSMGAENILAAFMGENQGERPAYLCRPAGEATKRKSRVTTTPNVKTAASVVYIQARAQWPTKPTTIEAV
jgi:hypothetical protein